MAMRVPAWWRLDGVMLAATDVSADRCRCERMSLRRHRVVHLVVVVMLTKKGATGSGAGDAVVVFWWSK